MKHPFAGVLNSDQVSTASTVKSVDPVASRRGLLGVLAGLVAVGTFGLLSGSKAQAQPATTLAVGEEGGRHATTYAVGEEGGRRVTTYAVGEEGGRPPVRVRG
jgi:hypothetical protein